MCVVICELVARSDRSTVPFCVVAAAADADADIWDIV
jgi:hypothetical protein